MPPIFAYVLFSSSSISAAGALKSLSSRSRLRSLSFFTVLTSDAMELSRSSSDPPLLLANEAMSDCMPIASSGLSAPAGASEGIQAVLTAVDSAELDIVQAQVVEIPEFCIHGIASLKTAECVKTALRISGPAGIVK
jgi:hypothetical protein